MDSRFLTLLTSMQATPFPTSGPVKPWSVGGVCIDGTTWGAKSTDQMQNLFLLEGGDWKF